MFQHLEAQRAVIELQQTSTSFDIIENNENKLNLFVAFNKINANTVNTEKGFFTQISIPQAYSFGEAGNPELPAFKKLISIPQGTTPEIIIKSHTEKEYPLSEYGIENKIMPAQTDFAKNDTSKQKFYYNPQAYIEKTYSEHEIVNIEILGTMRGVKIARLTVVPVKYIPTSNIIKVFNNIKVEINYKKTSFEKIKKTAYTPYFKPIFDKLANKNINKTLIEPTGLTIKYLIVADSSFKETLKPFIEWKTQKGFEVIQGYTDEIGHTNFDIETWIHQQYNSGLEIGNAPVFLLLVGDVDKIPTYEGTQTKHPTDLYYASVDDDMFPEMYYGRFSVADSVELTAVIEKNLYYEKYMFSDPSYLDKATLIAGIDQTWNRNVGKPTIEYAATNYFNYLNGYTTVNKFTNSYTDCYTPDKMAVGFLNYTAHALPTMWQNPEFNNNDVGELTNANQYPFVVGNACLSADFGTDICFGEAWLRKEKAGAVAYIGSAPNSWWLDDFYWSVGAFPMVGDNSGYIPLKSETGIGIFDALFNDEYTTASSLVFAGNMAVTEVNINGYNQDSSPEYYWEAYNLLGDPSLSPYFTQGKEFKNITHDQAFILGKNYFEIYAPAGSYIGISKNGKLIATAYADQSGYAKVKFTTLYTVGEIDIVITKNGYIPYITKLPVIAPEGAFVVKEEVEIIEKQGIKNGKADYNEQIELKITLKNIGSRPASEITASLSSSSEYIDTIYNNIDIEYPDIDTGSRATSLDNFIIKISSYVPDQEQITFDLLIKTLNQIESKSTFNITVDAPNPIINFVKIEDANLGVKFLSEPQENITKEAEYEYLIESESLGGNNNGLIDAGETIDVIVNIANNGHTEMKAGTCSLTSKSNFIKINTDPFLIGVISSGAVIQKIFNISVAPETPIAEFVDFDFVIKAGEYESMQTLKWKIGLSIEDFETGNFELYNWETSGDKPWKIDSENEFEGNFCVVSGEIKDSESSILEITLDVLENDTIKFETKISTEADWDYFKFYINGVIKDRWSGNINREEYKYPVRTGKNTFKWEYIKDEAQSSNADRVWLDEITLPAFNDENTSGNLTITAVKIPDWLTLSQTLNGNATLTGTAPDTVAVYDVSLLTSNGARSAKQKFSINVGGLSIKNDENNLKIYPLPASQTINLTFSDSDRRKITISDIFGKKYYSKNISKSFHSVNVSMFPTGIYFIQINNNKKISVKKIIIER